jgi:hypothetical protein
MPSAENVGGIFNIRRRFTVFGTSPLKISKNIIDESTSFT